MTENEWVKTHTTGPFKDYDPDVVAFIGEILYDGRIPAGEPGSVKNNGSVCRGQWEGNKGGFYADHRDL